MNILQVLNDRIISVCPIDGVSIGNWNDKSTWRISFAKDVTDAQKTSANIILRNFDPAIEQAIIDNYTASEINYINNLKKDNTFKSPEQAKAWVQANINNLSDAKSLLATMAAALCVLIRKL
jgi:hypothetical protein